MGCRVGVRLIRCCRVALRLVSGSGSGRLLFHRRVRPLRQALCCGCLVYELRMVGLLQQSEWQRMQFNV